jgi:hypothetical protein
VAYLSSVPLDPFVDHAMALDVIRSTPGLPGNMPEYVDLQMTRTYYYAWYDFLTPAGEWLVVQAPAPHHRSAFHSIIDNGHFWSASSNGPQCSAHQVSPNLIQTLAGQVTRADDGFDAIDGFYDPTNGTASKGMIIRTSAGVLTGQ